MGPLKNPKHELFALGLAKGLSATEAYTAAGYKPDRGNAATLTTKYNIQARVLEITTKAAEKAGVTVERIVAELAKIAFSDIRMALDWGMTPPDENGRSIQFVTLKQSKDVDADTAATVSEVWQTAQGIRFKFHDKPQALEKLGKHLGMYKDEVNVTGNLVVQRVRFCDDE
jgi:phage terminase small subunit